MSVCPAISLKVRSVMLGKEASAPLNFNIRNPWGEEDAQRQHHFDGAIGVVLPSSPVKSSSLWPTPAFQIEALDAGVSKAAYCEFATPASTSRDLTGSRTAFPNVHRFTTPPA